MLFLIKVHDLFKSSQENIYWFDLIWLNYSSLFANDKNDFISLSERRSCSIPIKSRQCTCYYLLFCIQFAQPAGILWCNGVLHFTVDAIHWFILPTANSRWRCLAPYGNNGMLEDASSAVHQRCMISNLYTSMKVMAYYMEIDYGLDLW